MFNRRLTEAVEALTDELRRTRHAMSEASDKAKAAADRIVTTVEGLIAAVQKAAADLAAAIAAGASASDPAFQTIADELNAEADKAGAALTPPAEPSA